MRKVSLVAASVLALMVAAPAHTIPARAAIPVAANDGTPSLAPLIKKVAPSVVSIAVRAQSWLHEALTDTRPEREKACGLGAVRSLTSGGGW